MMNKLFFLLFASILFISCKKTPLVATVKSFSQGELPSCQSVECPEIQLDFLEYTGEPIVADSINKHINDFIIQTLYLGDPVENPTATTTEAAAEHFIKMYWTHNAEFPDLTIDYFAEINIVEQLHTDEIISLSLGRYMYTGGAHGYGSVTHYNVDTETGKEIKMEQLFSNSKEVLAIAETYFKEQYQIPEEASINDTRFWFEDDTFHFPETIGFTSESVIFHYNQYEVASYTDGPIIVEIPITALQPFCNYEIIVD